jgi:bifunctional DNA-binding transcriptional regulator/antitoxin component of YhaV-PrlF toxin-antitoxin module
MAQSKKGYVKKAATKSDAGSTRLTVRETGLGRATLVHMNPQGRITLPASARRRLGIEGEADLILDLEGHSLVLRPTLVLAVEDAWAYTTAHRQLLRRAHLDSREGRVRSITERDLGH